MTIRAMPRTQLLKVLETDEAFRACSFTSERNEQLSWLRLLIYKHGTVAAGGQMRVKVYYDAGLTKLVATSAWSLIADIDGVAAYWRGWLGFEFEKEWLTAGTTYHVVAEVSGYTRNGTTAYLALCYDRDGFEYDQAAGGTLPIAMQVYSYRKVAYA
jgi:hypothetical protein